jgi:phage-related minor tail protein
MAGLEVMATGANSAALAPLFDRSVIVKMRKSTEAVPQLDGQARRVAELLRTALAAWSASERDELAAARPAMPGFLANRSAQMWTPLLACSDAVGYGDEIRQAAEDLVQYADAGDDDQDVMGDLAGMISGWED